MNTTEADQGDLKLNPFLFEQSLGSPLLPPFSRDEKGKEK